MVKTWSLRKYLAARRVNKMVIMCALNQSDTITSVPHDDIDNRNEADDVVDQILSWLINLGRWVAHRTTKSLVCSLFHTPWRSRVLSPRSVWSIWLIQSGNECVCAHFWCLSKLVLALSDANWLVCWPNGTSIMCPCVLISMCTWISEWCAFSRLHI